MDKIIDWCMSCGYTRAEMCSREYAIQMVLDAIEEE